MICVEGGTHNIQFECLVVLCETHALSFHLDLAVTLC